MTDAGPGFPLRFYSRFSDHLDPLLIDSVSDIGDKAQVPGSKLELLKTKYKKTKKKHPKPQNHAVALRAFCPPRGGSSERPGGVVGAPPRESVALAGLPSPPAKIPAADRQAPPPGPPTCPKVDSFSSSEWFPLPNTPLSILATPFPSGRHRSPLSCRLPPPRPPSPSPRAGGSYRMPQVVSRTDPLTPPTAYPSGWLPESETSRAGAQPSGFW